MSELNLVELPVLEWLCGPLNGKGGPGLGWTYRDETQMAAYGRPLANPLVEALLVPALKALNKGVIVTDDHARQVIALLDTALRHPDRLKANRATLELLRDGATLVLVPGQEPARVRFIGFDATGQLLNNYTATNQYRVQGVKQCRDDTVLLVNGIPLVIAEYKSYLASGHDWREGVRQLHRYQRQAPLMLAPNLFCIAADEEEFRFGTVLFDENPGKETLAQHLDTWQPWLSLYPEQKGYWNEPIPVPPPDPLEAPVRGLLRLAPCQLLDFLAHFWVFETKKGQTTKKVARYQQFEAANEMVDRVVSLIGNPTATAQDRTGLVWHTQGSGKSLTMVYAAYKLRNHPALKNPTVLIVVDRRDLKTQLADDFEASDYPSVAKALGVQDLKHKLATGWRGTLVTTVQSFQQMTDLTPLDRDNIISLVDEAHRSQKGAGTESYAMTMRVKLPNAFRFGLTGTPIDRASVNTFRDFGPVQDGQQERYLSYYGIRRAIQDGATLEVHYQRDKVGFEVNDQKLNADFETMCTDMELEDEEAKDFVQRQRAQWKELARHPRRVDIVLDKMLTHFLAYPDPSGFKAQLVAVDRLACAVYKKALDAKLKALGHPPEWAEVIISSGQNSDAEVVPYEYEKSKQEALIDWFKLTPQQWETRNREDYGEDRSKWRPALKILIVCDRLLTGFDAPIEQVMYLDKPLRDHSLLQAVARTNRPLPAMNKRTGIVVDYFGVFDNLEKALNFDESIREEALIDWNKLRQTVPGEVKRCLDLFPGIPRTDNRPALLAALNRLADPDVALRFEHDFKSLERLWEAVSPDPVLYPHRHEYRWLCGIYVAHRRRQRGPTATYGELSTKTRQLIEENLTFNTEVEQLPVYEIGPDYLARLDELPTAADKAAALEAMLTRELAEDGDGFTYRQLGDRLQQLKQRRDHQDQAAAERLRALEVLATATAATKAEPDRLNLKRPGEYELFSVLRAKVPTATVPAETAVAEAARQIVTTLRTQKLLYAGWSQSVAGRKAVEQALLVESWAPAYAELGFDTVNPNPDFLAPAVAELAKTDV